MWPNRSLLELCNIEIPIVQAPMAGCNGAELTATVSEAGGLGSLPCAILSVDEIRSEVEHIRSITSKPFNVNFFCHKVFEIDSQSIRRWRDCLAPYYQEFDVEFLPEYDRATRQPFDEATCELMEELKPPVVSFHFGLPDDSLFQRVKNTGCRVMSSATTVAEAIWLENKGVDAIIAQGLEAGGHRGMFLSDDLSSQVGTMSLAPQISKAVKIPVIAAGGIGDGRGIAAAFSLGAAGAQIGTGYLLTPEANTNKFHRTALANAQDDETALTNLFSGRPARSIVNRLIREKGPISSEPPVFPFASIDLAPLRAKAEAQSCNDFTLLWAGQSVSMTRALPAAQLTNEFADEAQGVLRKIL